MWSPKKRKLDSLNEVDQLELPDEPSPPSPLPAVNNDKPTTCLSNSICIKEEETDSDVCQIDHHPRQPYNVPKNELHHHSQLLQDAKPNRLNEWLSVFRSWSNKERLVAFESLISSNICDLGQIRHLYSLIEPHFQRDFISLLPKELALHVLSFLEPKDLLRAAQTCRTWRTLCEDNLLWREKCQEEGLLDEDESLSDFFRHRLRYCDALSPLSSPSASNSYSSDCSRCASSQPFAQSGYKLNYIRQKTIEYNWRYGRFSNDQLDEPKGKGKILKDILSLRGHDEHVITCLQFNPESNLIVSGSDDSTLKVWSGTTGRCLRTLTGHTGGVWSSQLSPNNIVISGSTDRTLRVWNAITGECLHTLYGHTSTVRCMALHDDRVVSGSRDATLRVWDIKTGCCHHVLVGHHAAVRCVQFNGKIAVSGAYDFLVKVWDVEKETCVYNLEGHCNRVYSLQFDNEHIVSGSLDASIRVWSARTGAAKHVLTGHQSLTSGLQLRGNILVSGNADSTVKVWDINTGECLKTLAGENKHLSAVTCLQFNSRFVITSSDDGTVKIWDLQTGEFIRNLVCLPTRGRGGVVWRIRASHTKLVCAVGSRIGTEETKLLVLNFDPDDSPDSACSPNSLPFVSRPDDSCQIKSEPHDAFDFHDAPSSSSLAPSIVFIKKT